MDQESNQMEQHPVQCRMGCGFYSNAGTEGLCSVCYKDMIKKKQQPPNNMPSSLTPAPGAMASLSIDESSKGVAASSASSSSTSPAGPATSLETASPTVILPSEKRAESESESTISTAVLGASSSSSSSIAAVAAAAAENPVNASSDAADVSVSEEVPSPLASSSQDPDQGPKEGKKKKNRCLSCKKKVGLTGFTCRCGGLFCSIHRYSDKHECNFDYKELGASEIRKSNPVVVAKKVQEI